MDKTHIEAELQKLKELRLRMSDSVLHMRENAFRKFPFLFIFLSTFGVVATFLGMEMIIDGIPYLSDRPFMVLSAGILVLILTGALYKKLS